jgi:hypothetical protein
MTIANYAYTALDCANPVELAEFYSKITGLKVQPFDEGETAETCEWLELWDENKRTKMAFQKIDNYRAPTWPAGDRCDQGGVSTQTASFPCLSRYCKSPILYCAK